MQQENTCLVMFITDVSLSKLIDPYIIESANAQKLMHSANIPFCLEKRKTMLVTILQK